VPAGLALAFLAGLVHLLVPFFAVIVVLFLRCDLLRNMRSNWRIAAAFALACLPAVIWLAWAFIDRSWVDRMDPGNFPRAFRLVFFSLPDVYVPGIGLWLRTVPLLTVLLGASAAWQLFELRKQPLRTVLESPVFLLLYLLFVFGVFRTDIWPPTRYWFMVYPVMLLVVAAGFERVARFVEQFVAGTLARVVVPGLAILLIGSFLASNDFHIAVIDDAKDVEVAYRTGRFQNLEAHWYYRFDEASPAQLLNELDDGEATVIITGRLSAIDYYLDSSVSYAFYLPYDLLDIRFEYRSRARGTRELWTGRPLLGTAQELRSHTADASEVLLVRVLPLRDQECVPQALWPERWRKTEVCGVSRDGRIELLRVKLSPPLR
jgi:hypothetical protein